ncbi:efflux transporter [Dichomitus squalens]|uniref:Efflux transporter n=1 Tax=Dichomitus squalens TaxID=114155 RepID=A0A4V2K6J5_9APHY|nr:efflux transporter [Dichomitus squalens]
MPVHQDPLPMTDTSPAGNEKPTKSDAVPTISLRNDDHNAHAKRSMSKDIILICTVTFAAILNTANSTAVSLSLPTIGRDLNIAESNLQWIISAYSLSSGCLLLFLGRLADIFGRKLPFIIGCAWMGVLGLGCGFAQGEITLDILRGLQGLGPAAATPAAIGILAHTFPPSPRRSIAFATFAAGAPVGGVVGNIIGGVLTQFTAQSWRSTFWFMTGLSALCCLGGLFSIDADDPYALPDKRIDWLWAFLVTTGLISIVFVLSDGTTAPDGWKTGYIIALLVVGVFFLGGEISQTWWTPPPLMLVSIWGRANGRLAAMLAIAFSEWCSFNSFLFWVQLYYQDYLGLKPILTMVRLLPMSAAGVTCNVIVALVVGRVPIVYLVVIGMLFTGAANLLFAVIVPSAPYWAFGFPAAIISVAGADFVFVTGTLFITRVCLPHELSVGGAIFQTITQLGTASESLGVALNKGGTNAPKPAQLTAYKDAMWSGFAFALFGVLLAGFFLRGVGIVGHRKADSDSKGEKATHVSEKPDIEAINESGSD